jgi:hypothetical protein
MTDDLKDQLVELIAIAQIKGNDLHTKADVESGYGEFIKFTAAEAIAIAASILAKRLSQEGD